MSNGTRPRPPTKIMLLGTFHFEDAGRDMYKPQFKIDIEANQDEVKEVMELLAAYEPTKIAVEIDFSQQEAVDRDFQAFLRGGFELSGGEHHQLGFRLAQQLGHPRVYAVNAWGRYFEPPMDLDLPEASSSLDSTEDLNPYLNLKIYARERAQEHLLTQWVDFYTTHYETVDKKKTQRPLRETLLELNQLPNILAMHGHYLVDHFKVGVGHEYPGADVVTAWYNRNLRIFANLQRITEPPDERIVVTYGAGHIPILRHCAEASPEYDLVEAADYL